MLPVKKDDVASLSDTTYGFNCNLKGLVIITISAGTKMYQNQFQLELLTPIINVLMISPGKSIIH